MTLHPDGRRILWFGSDVAVEVWELEGNRCLHTLCGHTGQVNAVRLHVDGRRLLSAGNDGTLKVWDIDAGICLATWAGDIPFTCCAWAGERVLAGAADGEVVLLDIALERFA